MTALIPCPCGSGNGYAECCGPLHAGSRAAATAEALMRSRYTAYVRGDTEYLRRTWHPRTRPQQLELNDQPDWQRLEVIACHAGQPQDNQGEVEFAAHYLTPAGHGCLRERSRFERVDGLWCYLDGRLPAAPAASPGRNAPCPCGSGRKYKRCCGR